MASTPAATTASASAPCVSVCAAEAKERGSDQGAKTGNGTGAPDAGVALTGDLSKLNTAGDGGGPQGLSKRKKK